MLIQAREFDKVNNDNLVELPTEDNKIADGEHLLQDNGEGGTSDANNREYGRYVHSNGRIQLGVGDVSSPKDGGATVEYEEVPDNPVTIGSHSHPSGQVIEGQENGATITYKFIQPPSNHDISEVPTGQTRSVFARGQNRVYIYNNNGVVAEIPTESYIKKYE